MNLRFSLAIGIALKLRQNWRREAAALPAPARLAAFTLIELSIVLVIIGLIVGGVLVGQDLIEAAKVRKLVSQQEEFVTAVHTFRLKYNALPGDMKNATTFWGIDPNGCPTPGSEDHTTPNNVAKTETCNGDGDKQIFPVRDGVLWSDRDERYRFWQHLANAGLISGKYSGVHSPLPDKVSYDVGLLPGINSPLISYVEMYPIVGYMVQIGQTANVWSATKGHTIRYYHNTKGGVSHSTAVIESGTLSGMDTKFDDGKPATGKIQSLLRITNVDNCVTSDNPATSVYKVTSTGKQCNFLFNNVF